MSNGFIIQYFIFAHFMFYNRFIIFQCPFHGKIIGRDKEGVPSNPDDVEHMLSGKMKTDLGILLLLYKNKS
jgi:hypothetical protein